MNYTESDLATLKEMPLVFSPFAANNFCSRVKFLTPFSFSFALFLKWYDERTRPESNSCQPSPVIVY